MNNELKEHSFILEPDGKIYLKDGDNAVEVSNQKEILMHWKFPTANMIEGIPFTVGYCSVEERTTTECKMPHRSMCYTNCDCVAKLVALVTFPESGEKKRKSFKERLAEEMANQKGEKQSQEETRFNGFVVTIDDGFVCYEYRFPGGDHLSIQALAEAISSETGLEIESFQQVKTLNP
jgi:hypothetical protein